MMEAIFFWGGALGLLAAALLAVLPAFLFPRAPEEDSAQSENAAAASERLAALRAQIAAGEIGPEEAAADEDDIQRLLAEDEDEHSETAAENIGDYPGDFSSRPFLADGDDSIHHRTGLHWRTKNIAAKVAHKSPPAPDKLGALIACIVLLPGALSMYFWLGTPSALVAEAPSAPPSLEEAAAGLRRYLADNPQDADALALMGRALSSMERHGEAADFFARARAAGGDKLPLLIANIAALLAADSGDDEVDALLQKARTLAPDSKEVLFLLQERDRRRAENNPAEESVSEE